MPARCWSTLLLEYAESNRMKVGRPQRVAMVAHGGAHTSRSRRWGIACLAVVVKSVPTATDGSAVPAPRQLERCVGSVRALR